MADIGTRIGSLEDALAAVARVGPVAREYSQKAEDARALPVEVVDAIADAGLWGVFTPQASGGSGMLGIGEQFEIIRAMAYEDSSAGWTLFICGATAALLAARLPPQGSAEVFANGIGPMASTFNPGGGGQLVDGGLLVNGRWPFASGVGHASWVMANTIVLDEAGAPRPGVGGLPEIRSVVVPRDDVTIVDDWHVAGLRGTGSMTFTIDAVTVPEHRTFPFFGKALIDDPKVKLPLFSLLAGNFVGMAVGLAERALDEVLALLPTRVGPPTFVPASEDPVVQSAVGRAMAAIRGARESTRAIYARYDSRIAANEDLSDLPVAERAEIHQHSVWAAETCRGAVDNLFHLGGANSIYEPGVLQRSWRDINVLTQHLFLRANQHEHAAKIALGIEFDSPFI